MDYKGYTARIRYDNGSGQFFGVVANITDILVFKGGSILELGTAFRSSVNNYLAYCHTEGRAPDHPNRGRLVVDIDPDIHKDLCDRARAQYLTLDQYVEETLQRGLQSQNS